MFHIEAPKGKVKKLLCVTIYFFCIFSDFSFIFSLHTDAL